MRFKTWQKTFDRLTKITFRVQRVRPGLAELEHEMKRCSKTKFKFAESIPIGMSNKPQVKANKLLTKKIF